jgi:hypothetical protein
MAGQTDFSAGYSESEFQETHDGKVWVGNKIGGAAYLDLFGNAFLLVYRVAQRGGKQCFWQGRPTSPQGTPSPNFKKLTMAKFEINWKEKGLRTQICSETRFSYFIGIPEYGGRQERKVTLRGKRRKILQIRILMILKNLLWQSFSAECNKKLCLLRFFVRRLLALF